MFGIPTPALQFFALSRGKTLHLGAVAFGVARLPTDSIGNYMLTLMNVVVGSAIQIEAEGDATVFANLTADSATEIIVLPAYAAGSPNNDLRIKVRKGSAAPYYQAYETRATAVVGAQSIFVSQIPDE